MVEGLFASIVMYIAERVYGQTTAINHITSVVWYPCISMIVEGDSLLMAQITRMC